MKKYLTIAIITLAATVNGQNQNFKRALFLGNSYTGSNNLPKLVHDVAESAGDSLVYNSVTPGGYTLEQHTTNNNTLNQIAAGNWDFVVLQEQSQRPSFPIGQVSQDVYPYARELDSLINFHNTCVETVFYMTWGRKNGDAGNCPFWPPVCTYDGMDSLLHLRYRHMADTNNAVLSPVGALWHYIRDNHPTIELYAGDGSHPSQAGSYAAACAFYATIFRKDPTLISYDYTLNSTVAADLRSAAKAVVYDSLLYWNVGKYDPDAHFNFNYLSGWELQFTDSSFNADSYMWIFGDGDTAIAKDTNHLYTANGTYTVKLVVESCGIFDTATATITVQGVNLPENQDISHFSVYPNPASSHLVIESDDPNAKAVRFEIRDMSGRSILIDDLDLSRKEMVDISQYPPGMYILKIEGEGSRLIEFGGR